MEKPWKPVVIFAVAVLLLMGIQRCHRQSEQADVPTPDLVQEFGVFGTRAILQLWGEPETCRQAAHAIEDQLLELHDRISLFDEDSELIALNQSAFNTPFACSQELWNLLQVARRAYRESDGAFDVSIGPLMGLWGFHRKQKTYPDDELIAEILEAVGLDKIEFNEEDRTVRFTHPNTYLDFGGIAKGYALDLAVAIAREKGVHTGIIDLGGNIFCLENTPDGIKTYTIGIRDPQWTDEMMETVELRDQAVATSGNYENFLVLDGQIVHHIIDPRTGRPVPETASVTVIADQGWISDVFSTAVFVRGPEFVQHVQNIHPNTSVIFVRRKDSNDRESLHFDPMATP